ncbi:MAG: NADH-quinone oxidoreductase subunit K [Crenarchaeota archaeon]|nr:NADH-quinone oxidoreductase subunit K [Thermoproteota archaeon]
MDFVILSIAMLGIGIYGLLTKRHLLKVFISIELIATAATLNFVMLAASMTNYVRETLLILAFSTETAITAVVLAMMVIVSKKYGTNDVSKIIQHIKEDEEESEVN